MSNMGDRAIETFEIMADHSLKHVHVSTKHVRVNLKHVHIHVYV